MGLISFFKVNKYKRFSFEPRYYDERKEHREELLRELEEQNMIRENGVGDNYKSKITRGSMRAFKKKQVKTESRTTTVRLLVIIILLLALSYWLLH